MKRKAFITVFAVMTMSILTAIGALAADADVNAVLETSFQSIVGDITSTIGTVLPIALGVVGMVLAIKFGIRWFKSLIGKG